jgi:hypothetical protein
MCGAISTKMQTRSARSSSNLHGHAGSFCRTRSARCLSHAALTHWHAGIFPPRMSSAYFSAIATCGAIELSLVRGGAVCSTGRRLEMDLCRLLLGFDLRASSRTPRDSFCTTGARRLLLLLLFFFDISRVGTPSLPWTHGPCSRPRLAQAVRPGSARLLFPRGRVYRADRRVLRSVQAHSNVRVRVQGDAGRTLLL